MAASDPFATAKANLRDNVKTLMTVFAGIAGVLLAGTPFSGFGAVQPAWRLGLAALALLGSLVFVGRGIWILLDLLRPELAYPDALRDRFDITRVTDPTEHRELLALRKEFARRRKELLPHGIRSMERLERYVGALWQRASLTNTPTDLARWQLFSDSMSNINQWAGYTRLHQRVREGIRRVFWVGLLALLFIAIFAWAAGAPKPDAGPSTIVVGSCCTPSKTPEPPIISLDPVLFETDRSTLTGEAMQRIERARDHLRSHPTTGLLVYAYTDTQGSDSRNAKLARERARAVVQALLTPGGIAASRIFSTELPQTDLPKVTAPQVDKPDNRSVRMAVVVLPQR